MMSQRPVLPAGEFQRRPREEDEPLGVVGIVLGAAVERGAVEVVVVGDEVVRRHASPAAGSARIRASGVRVPIGTSNSIPVGSIGSPLANDLAIGRQITSVTSQPSRGERLGQRAGDVGQAACLGEGHCLTGDFEHAHRFVPRTDSFGSSSSGSRAS